MNVGKLDVRLCSLCVVMMVLLADSAVGLQLLGGEVQRLVKGLPFRER
jgi:hypothetical protein